MPEEFKSFYAKAGGDEGTRCNYPDRLDLYGCGCAHDCAYCYAKSLLDFRGLWDADNPKVADLAKVKAEISKMEPGSVVRLGGMTDCFQPAESRNQVAYHAIEALNRRGVHYLIVTKSPLISSAAYMDVLDPDLAHIQVSITGTNDAECMRYEKAAPPSRRIKAAQILQDQGLDVSLRLSPYLPQNTDLETIKAAQIEKGLVEFLRVNHWIEKWLPYDLGEYTYKAGGYRHLPLRKKLDLLKPVKSCFGQLSVCEDVDGHFQVFRNWWNANRSDCCNLSGVNNG